MRRNMTLLFALIIFSITFSQAQTVSDKNTTDTSINNSTKNGFDKSASSKQSVEKLTNLNKNEFSADLGNSFEEIEGAGKRQADVNTKMKEWSFYAGSFTVHKDLKGESQRAPVVLFGIRHAWSIKNNTNRRFRYYMDLNPLIIVNYRERRLVQTSPTTTATVGERKTVFGVGFVPLGLQYNWRNNKKFQPFIAGGMGVALFNKKFPDNRSPLAPDQIGNRFQLMPEFGGGVEIRNSETKSYFIGYKYHHMSNGYTAPLNVGYNTNMIYFGMYRQRGK